MVASVRWVLIKRCALMKANTKNAFLPTLRVRVDVKIALYRLNLRDHYIARHGF